jgi:hypothetical protein
MTSMVRSAADILAEIEAVPARPTPPAEPDWPTVIRWEEPPPRDPRGHDKDPTPAPESKYERLAAQLRSRPGEWALVYEGVKAKAAGMAMVIRLSQVVAFPNLDYEATTRTRDRVTRTYARYVGDGR